MNNKMTNIRLQRAVLFGAFSAILETQEEKTLHDIKWAFVNMMENLIEQEVIFGDEIEVDVLTKCKDFIEQEIMLENIKEII